MQTTVSQKSVPIHARKNAQAGDARALLAIPDGRRDIPRLIKGEPAKRPARWNAPDTAEMLATELGSRKAIAAAKAIVTERNARRAARAIAESARMAVAGQIAAKATMKAEAKRQAKAAVAAKRLAEKLGRVRSLVTQAEDFRTASQGTTLKVRFGAPGAESETETGWIDYKSHGYRKGIKSHDIAITVHEDYERRVHDRGLARADGILTLDAEPIADAPEGIQLYRAVWARQARGLAIDTERGIIARHAASGTAYHSLDSDPKKAISGLRRKLNAQGVPAEVRTARAQAAATARAAKQAQGITKLVDRLLKWDFSEIQHVVVEREHSLKAGNCEPGTDQFIDRFFPDRREPRATIGEIAARIGTLDPRMLAGADLTLARQLAAACLVAIRKDKQARRALMV